MHARVHLCLAIFSFGTFFGCTVSQPSEEGPELSIDAGGIGDGGTPDARRNDPPPGNPQPDSPQPDAGGVDASDASPEEPEPMEEFPPAVVSVSPENGATGVEASATLRIEFSKPMDRVATQAAYQSSDIPSGAVTFAWNAESTVLTIAPNSPLEYATGTTPAAEARAYTYRITTTARDQRGAALPADEVVSFRTMRRITQAIPFEPALSGAYVGGQTTEGGVIIVGDNAQNRQYISVLSYNFRALPSDINLESATLVINRTLNPTSGFANLCGSTFRLEDVEYATIGNGALASTATLTTNVTAGGTDTVRRINVLSFFRSDYTNRASRLDRTQFRFRCSTATNNNNQTDVVGFAPLPLELTYLMP